MGYSTSTVTGDQVRILHLLKNNLLVIFPQLYRLHKNKQTFQDKMFNFRVGTKNWCIIVIRNEIAILDYPISDIFFHLMIKM